MLTQIAPLEAAQPAFDTRRMLTSLADQFALWWQQVSGQRGSQPCARLDGANLVLSLQDAVTPADARRMATEAGYETVARKVTGLLDGVYPLLAAEVERLFHCYVGALGINLDPVHDGIEVTLQMRDVPGLELSGANLSTCR
jgi:hypothetical protein